MRLADEELLRQHYSDLSGRPFFRSLLDYLGSGPVVCMCLAAKNAPSAARTIIGATNPLAAGQAKEDEEASHATIPQRVYDVAIYCK